MQGQVLAAATVQDGRIVTASPGLNFDAPTGLITFPNPSNVTAIPVVSYISENAAYSTESVFIKEYGQTSVTVWQGAQDTSGRNHPPINLL
jgi:hypothetical protein